MTTQGNQPASSSTSAGERMGEVPPLGDEAQHSQSEAKRGDDRRAIADNPPTSLAEPMPGAEQPTAEHPTLEQLTPPGAENTSPSGDVRQPGDNDRKDPKGRP